MPISPLFDFPLEDEFGVPLNLPEPLDERLRKLPKLPLPDLGFPAIMDQFGSDDILSNPPEDLSGLPVLSRKNKSLSKEQAKGARAAGVKAGRLPSTATNIGEVIGRILRSAMVAGSQPGTGNTGQDYLRAGLSSLDDRRQQDILDTQIQFQILRELERQQDREMQLQTAAQRAQAYEDLSRSRSKYYDERTRLAGQPKPPPQRDPLINVGGAVFNRETGEWMVPPQKAPLPPKPTLQIRDEPVGGDLQQTYLYEIMAGQQPKKTATGPPVLSPGGAARRDRRQNPRTAAPRQPSAADKRLEIQTKVNAYVGDLMTKYRTEEEMEEAARKDKSLDNTLRAQVVQAIKRLKGRDDDLFGPSGGGAASLGGGGVIKWGVDANGNPVRLKP